MMPGAGRDRLPYEADGAVIKIMTWLAAELGVVGKDPRGAVAFKFPAREVAPHFRISELTSVAQGF